ncbi:DUF167 family protein [Oceanibacterium hippocampi]|uniref:UPF0235 protein OCH7691_00152 n=1 Tax=Oceanibacterium hippocampi TaxID=745714 RepID=A0A1Y5R9L3_9PROT|nr:DUF167 family protein [Oceanibacterium hippocampi]SLN12365.1 hypothetical protein OCH7691_00152 [Oceanibacterium hippocampi]
MSDAKGPFFTLPDGIGLAIRLIPKGGRDAVDGIVDDGEGGRRLKLRVKAVPEKGKANAALIRFLARQWRMPQGEITLVAGARDRNKTLHVAGEPATLAPRLRDWLRAQGD